MSSAERTRWDLRYAAAAPERPKPARVLFQNTRLLPATGLALDLACGRGGNAVFLAERGFRVDAWDISSVAIASLRTTASLEGLAIDARDLDVTTVSFPVARYDVIVVSRFLDRALAPALVSALSPGGLLFYQTYTLAKLAPDGPCNPAYLLAENELLGLFGDLSVRFYREDGRCGKRTSGARNEAYFVGQKTFPACEGE